MKFTDHKVFFSGIVLTLLIFFALVVFSYRQADQAVASAAWVAHTHEVLFHTEKLLYAATNLETGERAYLLTGQQEFLFTYQKAKTSAREEIRLLRQRTADNLSQQPRIDSLENYINKRTLFSDSAVSVKKGMSLETALQVVTYGGGRSYTSHIETFLQQMQAEENRLLKQRKDDNDNAIVMQHNVFIYFVFIMLCLLVFIFWKEKLNSEYREKEKSGRTFRDLLESAPDAMVIINADGLIVLANQRTESLFGYQKEEMLGRQVGLMIPAGLPLNGIHPGEPFNLTPGKGSAGASLEIKAVKKGGKEFQVEVTLSPVHTAEGLLVSASIRDITERKEIQSQLERSKEDLEEKVKVRTAEIYTSKRRFRALVENNYDIISLLDESFNILYRSPSATRILGWSDEEMKNLDGFANIHPEDREKTAKTLRDSIANPFKPINALFRRLHKEGHYLLLEGMITNLLNDENVKAIVFNFHDVTERMEAEEKLVHSEKIYKTIASSIPGSVICLFDPDYRYLLIEGDMVEKLGYSRDQLLGNKAEEVLPPETFAALQGEFRRVLEGETVTKESERYGYDFISRYVPLKDEDDRVTAIMTVAIDITELKNAQRNITELNENLESTIIRRTEELRKSNEDLEAFSYSVSHDLRAPLRGIMGFASMLEEEHEGKMDDEAKRLIAVIKSNAEKMNTLITDLLAFSKVERQGIDKSIMHTNGMVKEIIDEMTYKRTGTSIDWVVHSLPDKSVDVGALRQVWTNLISNAIKYSGKTDHPKIEIGAVPKPGHTVFFVKDNGAGFDEKYMGNLFKVFQRLHSVNQFEGTGVGLAIVGKIVSKHGGSVWAEAMVNKGATFYFSLPD